MNLLLKLLTFPVMGPLDATVWAARKIAERAENVYYDDMPIRVALQELELRLDLGEISEEAFEAEEALLLVRLQEVRDYKRQQAVEGMS
jgi:hypothetical protein